MQATEITSTVVHPLRPRLERLLYELADQNERHRVTRRDVREDSRFPGIVMMLGIFGVEKFDDILEELGLWPEHPSDDCLIWSLRRFYIQNGRAPTLRDAEQGDLPYSKSIYKRRFGSWNQALIAAGIPCLKPRGGWANHDPRWDDVTLEMMVQYFRDTFGGQGRLPTEGDYAAGGYLYPLSVCIRECETWENLSQLTGLPMALQFQKRPEALRASDDEMLFYLLERYWDEQTLPTIAAYNKSHPKYSAQAYCKRFGSWRNTAKLLGYRLASDPEDLSDLRDTVLLYLMIRYESTGILPTAKEYKASNPEYSYELCIKLFKTWHRTAKMAYLTPAADSAKSANEQAVVLDAKSNQAA